MNHKRRERIALAVLAALGSLPATVERGRRSLVDAIEAPHLNLVEGGHDASQDSACETLYTMRLDVEAAVSAPADALLLPAANALYAAAIRAVMADPTLGGLCSQVRETGLELRLAPVEESAAPLVHFALALEAEFRCPDADPAGSWN